MRRTAISLFAMIFALVACFSTFSMAYANAAVDAETAVELIKNARDIMRSFNSEFQWFITNPDGTDNRSNDIWVDGFNGWNMVSYFRPVKDGFDAEGVKKLIGNTFAKPVADNYLAIESFYDLYYSQDGKLYYYISYGSQLGDFSSLALTDEEIENLSLVGPGTAAVKTSFQLPFDDYYDGEVTVFFSFEKETDGWKVSGMDAGGALFKYYSKEVDLSSFSEETARTEIRVLLGDIYRVAHVDGGEFVYYLRIDDRDDGEGNSISRFGQYYFRINGGEGRTETWLSYASRFATEEIAEKLVKQGLYCISEGGRMYYRGRHAEEDAFAVYRFRPEVFDGMELEIVSQTENSALVNAKLPGTGDQETEITFEFTLTGGQWKVSGGNFIEVLDGIYAPDTANAYTGDTDGAIFAAVIVIGVLAGTVFQKKKRERVN